MLSRSSFVSRDSTSRSVRQPAREPSTAFIRDPAIDAIFGGIQADLDYCMANIDNSLANIDNQYSALCQIQETVQLSLLHRLEAFESLPGSVPPPGIETPSPRLREHKAANIYRSLRASYSFASITESSTSRPQKETATTQPRIASRQSDVGNWASRLQESTSSSRYITSSHTPQLPSRTSSPTERKAPHKNTDESSHQIAHLTRREIEGACGICLEDLKCIACSGTEEHDDPDRESDGDTDEEDGVSLVYCKAQCGTNFHESCFHEWSEYAERPICPICRIQWTK
ncbi:hypothetical protein N7490_010686 [Penicillium lividum]|nr:hypothetical protein N7490_010686 [Penicillium lividum]